MCERTLKGVELTKYIINGKVFRAIRRECLEMSQEEVAQKIGVTQKTVHAIEHEANITSMDTFIKICELTKDLQGTELHKNLVKVVD